MEVMTKIGDSCWDLFVDEFNFDFQQLIIKLKQWT
jgi:hypothetical protein